MNTVTFNIAMCVILNTYHVLISYFRKYVYNLCSNVEINMILWLPFIVVVTVTAVSAHFFLTIVLQTNVQFKAHTLNRRIQKKRTPMQMNQMKQNRNIHNHFLILIEFILKLCG